MKVAYLLDAPLDCDAGAQQYFKNLARFMRARGHRVRFLVPDSPGEREFCNETIVLGGTFNPPINTTTVPLALWARAGRIERILDRERFDIIHVFLPTSPLFGARVLKRARCPVVGTYGIYTKNLAHRIFVWVEENLLANVARDVDFLAANSDAAREDGARFLRGEFHIMPLGVDLDAYTPAVAPLESFSDGRLNLLFVGRLEERKGLRYLLDAFRLARPAMPPSRLIVAGDGPLRRAMEKLAREYGIHGDVVFAGYVDERVKPRYYASADLCVFPAVYGECFGVVLLEAMASRKPTIAFDNPGYRWVMRNVPELLVPNRDAAALADLLVRVAGDPEWRGALGARCLAEVAQYSTENVGARMLDVYCQLAAQPALVDVEV